MQIIYNIFNTILDAGAVVMLPIIITIIGLIFGIKLSKAFRSGLTIGIGFAGINLVINLMKDNIGPAAKAMVENFGINLDIVDVGWGSIAAVTWSSPIIAILIFAILATNIIMLVLNATETLDVDIWNYHHMAIVGIMVYFVTKSVLLGILATVLMAIITFKLSDWTAPLVEDYFGIPGVSLPTMSALSSVIIAYPLNWIIDKIPGINKLDFEIKDAKKYLGIFGEPSMMGLILGMIVGILAKYLFQFDDIKISKGYLQIFEKEFLFSMGGWKAEHKIHTENETFNKRFSVYASNEHNAYYILTPQRIEKIMYFADIVNGQISLVFYDKNLFVAVRGESMFDANINEPVVNQTTKITKDAKFIQVAKEILIEK